MTWRPDPEFPDVLVNADSVAGPPDLAHAIQAAAIALGKDDSWFAWDNPEVDPRPGLPITAARIAVEAAAPVLLQATRDRAHALKVEVKDLERRLAASDKMLWAAKDLATNTDAELEATRDRLADLEVYAAELRDLLRRSMRIANRDEYGNCQYCKQPAEGGRHAHCWWCGLLQPEAANPQHPPECPVGRVLQTDSAPQGRAILEEVERLRTFQGDIRAALRPGRWRGFDGPDGVSKDEVIADVAGALAALDLGAAQEEDGG